MASVDAKNIVKAMERTPSRVVFVDSGNELDRVLKHPFAAWRMFLHPVQRKIAYGPRYAGPVQVTGGAGTGKTVTALHRAAHLARQTTEQLTMDASAPAVLMTTFTRNLAESLESQFDLLGVDDVRAWRQLLLDRQLVQPVKQASREKCPLAAGDAFGLAADDGQDTVVS